MKKREISGIYDGRLINAIPQAQDIKDMLSILRKVPGMMGAEISVQNLESFLNGYIYCRQVISNGADWDYFVSFVLWVHDYYGSTSTVGWSKLINDASGGGPASMSLFWKLYDEYLALKSC